MNRFDQNYAELQSRAGRFQKLAKKHTKHLVFEDIIRLDDVVGTYTFHIGDVKVSIPMLGIDFILHGDEASRLLDSFRLSHLSLPARKEVSSAISYYEREGMEFYWRSDCLLDDKGEFGSASSEIKQFMFKGLQKRLEAYVTSYVLDAFNRRRQ